MKKVWKQGKRSDSMETQGRSQEFSFTEARLKGKGTSDAGGLGGCAPQKLTQYIKVTFSNLLNSYDNTMGQAYYVCNCV